MKMGGLIQNKDVRYFTKICLGNTIFQHIYLTDPAAAAAVAVVVVAAATAAFVLAFLRVVLDALEGYEPVVQAMSSLLPLHSNYNYSFHVEFAAM